MYRLIPLAAFFLLVSTLFSAIGIGGGILYVPILLAAGYTMRDAPSISLMVILATSTSALSTFWREGKVDWKLALVIDPPTDIMALVGGYLSGLVPERLLEGILAATLALAGSLMLSRVHHSPTYDNKKRRWWHWRRRFAGSEYWVNLPAVLFVTGAVGLLAGMLGITGGIIKLPVMVLLCGVPMDIAVGTSTVMVAVTAASGLVGHALQGQVPWATGLLLALSAALGGLAGSRISISTDRQMLRRIFGVIVLVVAGKLAWGLIGG